MLELTRTLGWWLMLILAAIISAYALGFAFLDPVGNPAFKEKLFSYPFPSYMHIVPGAIAMIIGPFQLNKRFRARNLDLHRLFGKIYLSMVMLGGCAGLYLAIYSDGGLVGHFGFGMLAVLWLYSGIQAYLSIRRGDVIAHQRWMIRNYALTLAGVSLRLLLGVLAASGTDFNEGYQAITWLCWVPNLIIAEWVFQKTEKSNVNAQIA